MIIVTGGAGFIGSNIVRSLNERGIDDILIIDDLTDPAKVNNLSDLSTKDYADRREFSNQLSKSGLPKDVKAVFHQGACSDTMATNGRAVMEMNFSFSKILLESCVGRKTPLIYASSAAIYGTGKNFSVNPKDEAPLNVYAYSKFLFDRFVNDRLKSFTSQVVGLRYFNVYGPREGHKGKMASVIYQMFHQLRTRGYIKLFEGTSGFGNGEQRRDFVYVKDVVAINLYMLEHIQISGIVNVGTGKSRSFNDVALAVINTCRALESRSQLSIEEARELGIIVYYPIPEGLIDKYQSFTEANIDSLQAVGFETKMTALEDGVTDYVNYLHKNT